MSCNCTHRCHHRKYGISRLMLDCILVLATGGLWFIWILVREMRNG